MKIKKLVRGFTLVEVSVVMAIIGILATVTYVAYNGLQSKARDVSVQSDIDRMDALQTSYGIKHNTAGKSYYSVNGTDSDLAFTPSNNNVIKVEVNSTDYCIRGYNPNGTYNTINNAAYKESTTGTCALLNAINIPDVPGLTVAQSGGVITATIIPTVCSNAGTEQFGFRSSIDNGVTWTTYSAWSATITATQAATFGVTYSYQVQTRCYSDESLISTTVLTPVVSYTHIIPVPAAPVIASVVLSAGNVIATIGSITCPTIGTPEYSIESRTNNGTWSGYSAWSAWSASSMTSSLTAVQGVQYGFIARSRCVSGVVSSDTAVGVENSPYTVQYTQPSQAPTIAVSITGGTVTATITGTPTCPSGAIVQYAFKSRTNDSSTWGSYSTWSNTILTSSQSTAQGVKYGYIAQARCYVSSSLYSDGSESLEQTAVASINAPGAPTVSWTVNDWQYTTWNWSAASCPAGSTGNYQTSFFYDNNPTPQYPIYTITTATSSQRQTSRWQTGFYMRVEAQCQNANTASGWSAWGTANNATEWFIRNPTMQILVVAGGGGGGSDNGGGGGGGGLLHNESYGVNVSMQQNADYWVEIGGGGGGGPSNSNYGGNGGNSSFMYYYATSGGRGNGTGIGDVSYGGGGGAYARNSGHSGGSGGAGGGVGGETGGGGANAGWSASGSVGLANAGGKGGSRRDGWAGGGGGGAGGLGQDYYNVSNTKQEGGAGYTTSIDSNTNHTYAGGGGGGGDSGYMGWGHGGGGDGGGVGANYYGGGGGGGWGGYGGGGGGYSGVVVVKYNHYNMYANVYNWNGSSYNGLGQYDDGTNYSARFDSTAGGKISFAGYF